MIRRNSGVLPASRCVPPNGVYDAYRHLFDEIFVRQDFEGDELESLYVFERAQYAKERYIPRYWHRVELVNDPILAKNFHLLPVFGTYERELLSFLMMDIPGKFLRIVGEPGSGKSTFVRYLFDSYLPKQRFAEHASIASLDLAKVLRTAEEYSYEETVRAVIKGICSPRAIKQRTPFLNDIWDEQSLIRQIHSEVSDKGANHVCIVFDNVDVFSSSFQHHLTRFCDSLAAAAGCTLIATTRLANAERFQPPTRANSITDRLMLQRPPVLRRVVERRLRHLLDVRRDQFEEPRRMRIAVGTSSTFFTELDFADVESFVTRFVRMLSDEHLSEALENLTNYNVRVALLWVLDLMSSWNLNLTPVIDRTLQAARRNAAHREGQHLPLAGEFEVVKADDYNTVIVALGLCNHEMYFPEVSHLDNIFSAGLSNHESDHLIKFRALQYCSHLRAPVPQATLLKHLERFGYTRNEIQTAADLLLSHTRPLLESTDGEAFENVKTVEITHAGKYYLERLIYYVQYVQIVTDDIALPPDLSINQGSWEERMDKLIGVLTFLGSREISEAERFLRSGDVRNLAKRDYSEVYGTVPLAARMLESLLHFVSGRGGRRSGVETSTERSPLAVRADVAAKDLTESFQRLLVNGD